MKPEVHSKHLDAETFEDVPTVLRRTGAACQDLATAATWLQDQMSVMVESGRMEPCRESTMALQELDRISQMLHDLARLTIEIGGCAEGASAPREKLLAAIHLDSLSNWILDQGDSEDKEDEFWH